MKKQFLAMAVAAGLAMSGSATWAAETIKIGLMAPLTGSWASEGQGMKKIVEAYFEQQNEAMIQAAKLRSPLEERIAMYIAGRIAASPKEEQDDEDKEELSVG